MNDDLRNVTYSRIKDEINVNNVAALYYSSQLFSLSEPPLRFIERCFPMFVDSLNFLELDVMSVAKLLSSSELNVDTEFQVFEAANGWLSHNLEERGKHASYIFSKIRVSLLSTPALKHISNKHNVYLHASSKRSSIRYCKQENFNIIVCGSTDVKAPDAVSDVISVQASNRYSVNILPQTEAGGSRNYRAAVCVKGKVYAFDGVHGNGRLARSVEMYSPATKTWQVVAGMDVLYFTYGYCACSFADKIYLIGATASRERSTCVEFDTKNLTWNQVGGTNRERCHAACAVFEGKITVCGGGFYGEKTVEVYDPFEDSWTYVPSMIKTRIHHKSVAVKNKLFAVGGLKEPTCEVFDSRCGNFVFVATPKPFSRYLNYPGNVMSIGNKLVLFESQLATVLFYDLENDKWSKQSLEVAKDVDFYCYAKVPQS